ncbi:hypothetical protein [Actinomycetospora sp. NBRC 106378]|uniref:hypothetical protein n=1 Tax=Actinomycetospora sp. NBRC 106378 TaxID=3032208 RepID=UPI0024A08B20|nr:hypothetical protein [Actinomycetospora sp. NBRC 106378]GLZ51677.1 hypothetical protein Acsp07_12940 [Actinomycetospora sp. NBRC 106378]
MFGRKKQSPVGSHDDVLRIRVIYMDREHHAKCPFSWPQCPDAPSPRAGSSFLGRSRSKETAIEELNDHLAAVHGVDRSVPRRFED